MKRRLCLNCHTWLRYEDGATTVACGECGANYTIKRRLRQRGVALQLGILRALRSALGSERHACKACEGTGLLNPAAAERASVRSVHRGRRPAAPPPCPRCEGSGQNGKRVRHG